MSNQKRFALIGSNIGPIDKSDELADGDILVYNASTGKWVSQSLSASAITITESQITDGAILARVAANETISGTWTFSNTLTLGSGLTVPSGFTLTTGGGTFTIAGTGETLATFADDGAVTLYHNNIARLATSAVGVSVLAGSVLSVLNTAGTGLVQAAHDGTDGIIQVTTGRLLLAGSNGIVGFWRGSGVGQSVRFYDDAGTDYAQGAHDGTNFNWSHVNTATVAFSGASTSYTFDNDIAWGGGSAIASSANVALLSASNTFTGLEQTITGASAALILRETGGTADEGGWEFRADGDELNLYTLADVGGAVRTIFGVTRSGTNIGQITLGHAGATTEVELNATTLDFNGAADFSSTITLGAHLLLSGVIEFDGDADTYIDHPADNTLALITSGATRASFSAAEIDLTATLLDFNGAADFSSTISIAGNVTCAASVPELTLNNTDNTATDRAYVRYRSNSVDRAYIGIGDLVSGDRDDLAIRLVSGTLFISTDNASSVNASFSNTEIDLTATTLDFNGAADFSGNITAALNVFSNQAAGAGFGFSDDLDTYLWSPSANVWQFVAGASGVARFSAAEVELSATTLDFNGACNIAGGLNAEPESRSISASETTAATDQGMIIRLTGGSGQTLTLDGDPPTDATVVIDNSSGAAWTIAASGTLIWAATAGTGNRTLADDGMACALHRGSGVWLISGNGLS